MRFFSTLFISLFVVTGLRAGELSVVGEATLSVMPDQASVHVQIDHRAETAVDVLAQVAQFEAALRAAMASIDVPASDVTTGRLSLNRVRRAYEERRDLDPQYEAQLDFIIRAKGLEKVGHIIEAAFDAGVNELRSVQFSSSQEAELREKLRKLALSDAVNKAKTYEEVGLFELGSILKLNAGQVRGIVLNSAPMMMEARSAVAPELTPGALYVSEEVSVTFEIKAK